MDVVSGYFGDEEPMDLAPGFRFHPTDEELITHYLSPKVLDSNFSARAIGVVDLNKCEPWDLPRRAKMGEREWYFFCMRDRKYPTGLRTNRATDAGYWKATGKDKEIYRGKDLVGMKKTLVFYKGRAPKGAKSNWVIHEYRLEGKSSPQNLPTTSKNEWVISRVFEKSADGKKISYLGLTRSDSLGTEFHPSALPPLIESSPYSDQNKPRFPGSVHVPCFSSPTINYAQGSHEHISDNVNSNSYFFQGNSALDPLYAPQIGQIHGNFTSDQAMLRANLETNDTNMSEMKLRMKTEREIVSISEDTCLTSDMNAEISSVYEMGEGTFEDQEGPSTYGGPVDISCFWNY
ncbi:hypothetical protein Nepgr_018789 [Nepenthes gracilis]|uniref:NAC domain-containing protein n=1 Tax=Nepenthes gracilis TaxID=150966 RepID=A0AAD3XTT3_NEPGR|nr:hypothetical protein Nepgr_018789 [Nepenthes gracilis]